MIRSKFPDANSMHDYANTDIYWDFVSTYVTCDNQQAKIVIGRAQEKLAL